MIVRRRVHVFYSGRVQGVGFRVHAEEIAQSMDVVGWVKNLRDGRVELMAEAEEPTLKHFLDAIRQGPMKNFIIDAEVMWSPAANTFEDFSIRYY